ncbi:antitoxin [Spirillospora sp. NBC_00431]
MSIVDKVKQMLGQHSDKAREGVEKAGDKFDERTGGKYSDKVDKAQDKAGEYIDRGDEGGRAGGPGGEHGGGEHGGGEQGGGGMPGSGQPS